MSESITSGVLEIVVSLVLLGASAIGTWLAKGKREVQRSEELERYSEAVRRFSPALYDHLRAAGGALYERVMDGAVEYGESDAYEELLQTGARYADELAESVGFRRGLISASDLDKLVRAAIKEARESYRGAPWQT